MTFPNLRDYQTDVVNRAAARVRAGGRRGIVQGETGCGKSVIIGYLAWRADQKASRVLILADRRRLIKQLSEVLDRFGVRHGVVMSGESGATRERVILASRDTLAAWMRRGRYDFAPFDVVLIDETHKAMADVYRSILDGFPRAVVIGFTATPARGDGKSLGDFFQWIECTVPASRLVADGWLVKPVVYAPPELAARRKKGAVKGLAGDPVTHWKRYADGLPTIAAASRTGEAQDLVTRFRAAGVPAELIVGPTDDKAGWDGKSERDRMFDRLASGRTKVLVSIDLLIEGVDIPEVAAAIAWRKFGSLVQWRQFCLDERTEVLTRRGWVGPDGMVDGDEVATFDRRTDRIEWCVPENVFFRPLAADECMYGLRNPHLDIRVTDSHAMVYRCYGETAVRWRQKTAAEVGQMGAKIRVPVAGVEGSPGLPLTDSDLRFIGWFITDGSLSRKNRAITINQSAASPHIGHIERCLEGCGFRYSVYQRQRVGRWAGYADSLEFRISYGMPKKVTERHLTGWARLEPYLCKDFAPALDGLSRSQLLTLLEAMNLGDGCKRRGIDWQQRTYSIGTGNRVMADRLQSLCVRRGMACNISTANRTDRKLGRATFHTLLIRPDRSTRTVWARELKPVPLVAGERVWCMTTDLGTLVTRRNGRVAVVGNCGRIMRPAPGKSRCIAEGQRVLTDVGLVPIERVTTAMRVWDGTDFVPHDGAVCTGVLPVITYAGLTATEDHLVWTRSGWRRLGECRDQSLAIAVTAEGERPIRQADGCYRGTEADGEERPHSLPDAMRRVRCRAVEGVDQSAPGVCRLPTVRQPAGGPEVACEQVRRGQGALPEPQARVVSGVRRPRGRVSVLVPHGNGGVDSGELGPAPGIADRPDRQQRSLRTGKHSALDRSAEHVTYPVQANECRHARLPAEAPGNQVLGFDPQTPDRAGHDGPADHCAVPSEVAQAERRVWDILNAGPFHRFTVEGLLVHNSVVLDHAGAAAVHGLPGDDVQWSLDLGSTVDERRKKSLADGTAKAPTVCRACGLVYSDTLSCPSCGWVPPRAERKPSAAKDVYEATDETLTRFDGEDARERRADEMQREWRRCIYVAVARGKKLGMAAGMFQSKFRVPPWEAGVSPLPEGRGDWQRAAADVFPEFVRARAKA